MWNFDICVKHLALKQNFYSTPCRFTIHSRHFVSLLGKHWSDIPLTSCIWNSVWGWSGIQLVISWFWGRFSTMNTLRILFIVLFGTEFKRNKIFVHCSNNEILFSPRVANFNILFMSLANYQKHYKYPKGSVCAELLQLLLVISGNMELNPGSRTPKYPCGECNNAVAINSIVCDICNTW